MRTTAYKCDRCGKPISSQFITKININMQKGNNPPEKKPYDFCSACFLKVKASYLKSLKVEGSDLEGDVITNKSQTDMTVANTSNVKSEKGDRSGMKLGSIDIEERNEILRLYVEENLNADQIAEKMNRLPRGIKRTINSAKKSGELNRLMAVFQSKQTEESDDESDEISDDSYATSPQKEVIDGKSYDVGGILALAKAGWTFRMIAGEKHYDEDVVRIIIEKYM